ncbi:trans-sulfuration enzyme family protein [Serinibacter arcticus]|uniref:homocysteine desulfhydrase n=1 Tax=Serinibacter arcticus TaxID=1655435 RepID=A0A4Z1DZI8_9MICO|nr:aminotransferase class I/II-fold pyridoxal phosphate-dependent enzyme [Serinibacter arcticus]TGO04288.1 Cystathionine gamma-synthase [Serinibacter arcticus]
MKRRLRPATVVVEAGRPVRTPGAPVNSPIVMSSTYVGHEQPGPGELVYARIGTESWEPLEEALGQLENAGRPGLLFASGMAAISAALDLTPVGGAVVAPRHAYHESLVALRHQAERSGVRPRLVDIADTAAVRAAIRGDGADLGAADTGPAALVWLETPTNPMLEIADVAAISAAAHEVGAIVVVDNTFATPLLQRPLELGADVVVHSVTKYLAGHSDVILGAVVTRDENLLARVRQRRTTAGGVAGPFEAWLALRGLRTLALRVERAQANAHELARRLQDHPAVLAVAYPGLPDHPQHELATNQMDGYGSILTLRVRGGAAAAARLTGGVHLWLPATSLGGVESMVERRRRWPNEAPTVPEDLLRVSVGIEDVEDLWDDLDQALRASQA